MNTPFYDGSLNRLHVEEEAEEALEHWLWIQLKVLIAHEIGWNRFSDLIQHNLVVQLHVVNLLAGKLIPVLRMIDMELLVGDEAMTFCASQHCERWNNVDRVACYHDHFIGGEGLLVG